MGNRTLRHKRAGSDRNIKKATFSKLMTGNNDAKAHQERQAMYDINEMMVWARKNNVRLLTIGGYAARAYTGPTRYTHDVDMVVHQEDVQRIGLMLKEMDYRRKKMDLGKGNFAYRGEKTCRNQADSVRFHLEVHISVGSIYDASSTHSYTPLHSFESPREMDILGFYEENRSFVMKAMTMTPEELLIVKLMIAKIRPKDLVDITGLVRYGMIESPQNFDPGAFVEFAMDAGLAPHMTTMIRVKLHDCLIDGRIEKAMQEHMDRKLLETEREALDKFKSVALRRLHLRLNY